MQVERKEESYFFQEVEDEEMTNRKKRKQNDQRENQWQMDRTADYKFLGNSFRKQIPIEKEKSMGLCTVERKRESIDHKLETTDKTELNWTEQK